MNSKKIFIIISFFLAYNHLIGQDVEHMLDRFKKKPFKFTGDISANQVLYGAWGNADYHRQPYTYYLNGNLNVAFYGWNFPFSFSLSDQTSEYTSPPMQDFSRYGVTPYYKWVKLYAGYNSMTFSPYTYNGYTFLGGGSELTPGNFIISGFYGRMHKAVEEDTINAINAVYKRTGYGLRVGYKKESLYCDINFFRAADDSNSIQQKRADTEITPGENVVVGFKAGYTFIKKIKTDLEYARSAYSKDIRTQEQTEKAPVFFANIKGLFTPRVSSSYYSAYKAGLNYLGNGYGFGFGYEHIDPGYQTMGAYYFNNDLENITINANTNLFKQKMQLSVNIGRERNNLAQDQISDMKKTIGSVNINYVPSAKWNITASYSNFSSFINIRSNFDLINQVDPLKQLDTLNYTQITQSTTANISHVIGNNSTTIKQFMNLNLNSQIAANEQKGNSNSGSSFYNAGLSYTINLLQRNLSVTTALNGNYTKMPETSNKMFGPMLAFNKMFFEKTMRLTSSIAWNRMYIEQSLSTNILNLRINTSYSIKKKHNINLALIGMRRNNKLQSNSNLTEFTGTLGYSYSFTTSDEKEKEKNDNDNDNDILN